MPRQPLSKVVQPESDSQGSTLALLDCSWPGEGRAALLEITIFVSIK